jgi:hypothetical protein
MAPPPSLSLTVSPQDSNLLLTWDAANFTPTIASIINVIITDQSVSAGTAINGIVSYAFSAYTTDTNGTKQVITSISLGSDKVPAGIPVFIMLKIDGISSLSVASALTSKPVKPVIQWLAGDSQVSLTLTNFSSSPTSQYYGNDGFSVLTKLTLYYSSSEDGLKEYVMDISTIPYGQRLTPAITLTNTRDYEMSVVVENALGASNMSNTQIVTARDTPNQVQHTRAINLLTLNQLNEVSPNTASGEVSVFWTASDDQANLLATNHRISSYIISEQEVTYNTTNSTWDSNGSPTSYTAVMPLSGDNEYATTQELGEQTYDFVYTIGANDNRLGKIYHYTVYGVNDNGNGMPSMVSNRVQASKIPSSPVVELISQNEIQGTYNITQYDGNLLLKMTNKGSLNGLREPISGKFRLKIVNVSDASIKFDDNVDFAPVYNTYATTGAPTGAIPGAFIYYDNNGLSSRLVNGVSTPYVNGDVGSNNILVVKREKGEFVYGVLTSGGNSGKVITGTQNFIYNNLSSSLLLGDKYEFSVSRCGIDSQETVEYNYLSYPIQISRTPFKNPSPPLNIEAYSFNNDFTPVKTLTSYINSNGDIVAPGASAISILVQQVPNSFFNGSAIFDSNGVYQGSKVPSYAVYKNSVLFTDVPQQAHTFDQGDSELKQFIVPASLTGAADAFYVRLLLNNAELDVDVMSIDSSPFKSAVAVDYVAPVTGLSVTTGQNSTGATITWNKAATSIELANNLASSVQTRIVVWDMTTGAQFGSDYVVLNTAASQSVSLTSLITGRGYAAAAISEVVYTKRNYNSIDTTVGSVTTIGSYKFNGAIIRKNVVSTNFIAFSPPDAPTDIQLFAGDKKVDTRWSAVTNFNGTNSLLSGIKYQLFANASATEFPQGGSPVVTQNFVTEISAGTNSFTMEDAYLTQIDAKTGLTALAKLVNLTKYNFAIRARTTVGGITGSYPEYTIAQTDNANALTFSTSATVLSKPVLGLFSSVSTFIPNTGATTPANLAVSSDAGQLAITIDKNANNNELVFLLLDDSDKLIASFDTYSFAHYNSNAFSGLFNIQNNNYAVGAGDAVYPAGFKDFSVDNTVSPPRYKYIFTGLTNGTIYSIKAYYTITTTDTPASRIYSTPSLITGTPVSAPGKVQNVGFSVESQMIKLIWGAPFSSGGAGVSGNSALKYRVDIYNSIGGSLVSNAETTDLYYNTASVLVNASNYKVKITAYYLIGGNASQPSVGEPVLVNDPLNTGTAGDIKVNAAPGGPSVTLTGGNNAITCRIETAAAAENSLYPIVAYKVSVTIGGTKYLVSTLYPGTNVSQTAATFGNAEVKNFTLSGQLGTSTHTAVKNGFSYPVEVAPVVTYTYAQSSPAKSSTVVPFGPIIFTSMVPKAGRIYTGTINLNGGSQISSLVAIAKYENAVSVYNPTILPAFTNAGVETSNLAALQLYSFDTTAFPGSAPITSILAIGTNATSSDAILNPNDATNFFTM